jgi:hypothetical protein
MCGLARESSFGHELSSLSRTCVSACWMDASLIPQVEAKIAGTKSICCTSTGSSNYWNCAQFNSQTGRNRGRRFDQNPGR